MKGYPQSSDINSKVRLQIVSANIQMDSAGRICGLSNMEVWARDGIIHGRKPLIITESTNPNHSYKITPRKELDASIDVKLLQVEPIGKHGLGQQDDIDEYMSLDEAVQRVSGALEPGCQVDSVHLWTDTGEEGSYAWTFPVDRCNTRFVRVFNDGLIAILR